MNYDINSFKGDSPNPFRVPEGYFDTIADKVMERIPDNQVILIPEETNRHKEGLKRWRIYVAAASIVAAIFGAGLFIFNHDVEPEKTLATGKNVVHTSNADNNVEAMADYIMADDYELYAYMAYE